MPLTSTIAELMLEKGRAQAAGQLVAANAYASALQNIGQNVGSAIASIPQQQELEKERQDRQRQRDSRDAFSVAMQNTPMIDLGNGAKGYDVQAIGQEMSQKGFAPEFSAAAEHLDKINQAFQSAQSARLQAVHTGALGVEAAGYDPTIAGHFLDGLQQNGFYPKETVQEYKDKIQSDPKFAETVVRSILGPAETVTLPPTPAGAAPAQLLEKGTNKVIATGGTPSEKPPTESELALRAARVGTPHEQPGDADAARAMGILKPKQAGDTAAADDQRFEKIQQALNLKQGVSPEDFAWFNAYKTRKLLGVDQSGAQALARQAKQEQFQMNETGRGKLTDLEKTYSDAAEKAETLRNVVQAAQGGNMVAGSLQPLLATLGVTTMEGVKRINNTELQNVAGAGSLLDRIKGKVGKLAEGQPMDKALQSDLVALANLLQKNAYGKYLDEHGRIKTRYGLSDEQPIAAPSLAPIKPSVSINDPGLQSLAGRQQ